MVDRFLAHATEIFVGRHMRFKSELAKTSFVPPYYSSGRSSQVSFSNRTEPCNGGGSFVRWPLLIDSTTSSSSASVPLSY